MEEPGGLPSVGSHRVRHDWSDLAAGAYASKLMLKILQVKLQLYVNQEIPDVQAGFRKGRGTRDQIVNIHWIIEKQESPRETSTFALMTMPKPLCGSQQTRKFWKRWEYQTTLPASWEICIQVRKQ